jgi:hypothetical protein
LEIEKIAVQIFSERQIKSEIEETPIKQQADGLMQSRWLQVHTNGFWNIRNDQEVM